MRIMGPDNSPINRHTRVHTHHDFSFDSAYNMQTKRAVEDSSAQPNESRFEAGLGWGRQRRHWPVPAFNFRLAASQNTRPSSMNHPILPAYVSLWIAKTYQSCRSKGIATYRVVRSGPSRQTRIHCAAQLARASQALAARLGHRTAEAQASSTRQSPKHFHGMLKLLLRLQLRLQKPVN